VKAHQASNCGSHDRPCEIGEVKKTVCAPVFCFQANWYYTSDAEELLSRSTTCPAQVAAVAGRKFVWLEPSCNSSWIHHLGALAAP